MAIQPSFPHLTQGRVPDVSNCEELRNRHTPFSTKLCTLVLKTVVHNLSGAQPANFFYDRMTILWKRENGDQEQEPAWQKKTSIGGRTVGSSSPASNQQQRSHPVESGGFTASVRSHAEVPHAERASRTLNGRPRSRCRPRLCYWTRGYRRRRDPRVGPARHD